MDGADTAYDRLCLWVGRCLLTWAGVELNLLNSFDAVSTLDGEEVLAVWEPIKSFDARLAILRATIKTELKDQQQLLDDWTLIDAEVARSYKARNQIAHSTRVWAPDGTEYLEPFFAVRETKGLHETDLEAIYLHFHQVYEMVAWFWRQADLVKPRKAKPTLRAKPVPDLLIRLRDEERQRREAQRQRHQDDALVRRLRQQGKWPPPEA